MIFLGKRNDVPQILSISNVVVSASYREGLPVNVMEALASGLPVIGLNCRGISDLIENGVNGFVINIDDNKLDMFTDAVKKIIHDKSLQKNISSANLEKIKNYTLDRIMVDMKRIYNKKKTVLHLLASSLYSGAENVACTIIENMSSEYDMMYCSPNGPIGEILNSKGICYVPINKLTVSELKRVIKSYSPDIIHAHDFKASIIASIFYRKSRIVSHIHKNDPKMKKVSLKSVLYFLLSKRFYKIVGVSDSILDEYVFKKTITKKYVTIVNFVDKDAVLRKADEFSISKNYDLFYFGRLSEEKNPLEFIEIVKMLENSEVKCVMVGDGPLRDECEKLINLYNLEKNIELVGFKSNPYPYIKASKIGVMPSKFEGFGLAAVESLILNKPVLNSGVGGLKEVFKNNEEFICLNRYDYVKKIKMLMENCVNGMDVDVIQYCNSCGYQEKIRELYK